MLTSTEPAIAILSLITAIFALINLIRVSALSNKTLIIEAAENSLFLTKDQLHIPVNRLVALDEEPNKTIVPISIAKLNQIKIHAISFTIKFKNTEYQNWVKMKLLKKVLKQDQTYRYVKITVPYAVGTSTDVSLEIARNEFIEKLNEYYLSPTSNNSLLSPK